MPPVRIMIVEDEINTAKAIKRYLEEWGYAVAATAATGAGAIQQAKETSPDLVLMDILLKGSMDGIEAAEQIRASCDIPIIYLTAHADNELLQRAKITEPYGYLQKPFEKSDLRINIEIALYKHQVDQELRQSRENLEQLVTARTAELSRSNAQLTQEIAEKNRIEKQLRRSEERVKLALEASHEGLWDWIIPENQSYWSPEYYRMLGYEPNELPASTENFVNLLHPDDRDRMLATFHQAIDGDKEYIYEFRLRSKTGDWRWIYSRGKVVEWDLGGKPYRILGTHVDITARKQVEIALQEREAELKQYRDHLEQLVAERTAQLREREEQQRAQFKGIPVPTYIWQHKDDDFVLIDYNDAGEKITQRKIVHLLGGKASDFYHDRPQILNDMRQCVESRAAVETEMTYQLKTTGEQKYLSVKYAFVPPDLILVHTDDITARKQIEDALGIKESAIASSLNAIAIASLDGKLTYVNTAFLKLWGYESAQEVLGRSVLEFWQEPDKALAVVQALQEHGAWVGELVAKRQDGSAIITQLTTNLITDQYGNPIATMAAFIDVTAQKQTEHALRESEARFRTLVDSMEDIVFTLDSKQQHTGVFGRWVEQVGMTPDVFLGKTSREIFGVDAAAIHESANQRALRGEHVIYEWTTKGADGKTAYIQTSLSPIRDAAGNVVELVGVGRDLTEQKRAEIERDRLFNLSVDMLCIAGFDGYFKQINPAWTKTLGWTAEELLGQPWLAFVHPEDHTITIFAAQILTAGQTLHTFENRCRCQDGSYRWLEWNAFPLVEEQLIFAVVHDVTEQKYAREALQHAKEEAEQANKAKSQFLANMSHELRTPLNAILGYTQLLKQDQSLTDQQRKAVHTIHNSSEHLLLMINEILDLSKIEARKLELEQHDFHLLDFLHGIVEIVSVRAKQKGIAFEHNFASELPTGLYGDEKRLRQVLLNVLNNAIKFTPKGRIMFRVKYCDLPISPSPHLPISPCLRFEVEDTGIGIAAEELEHIFLSFHQGGDAKNRAEGTGLGLAISQQLVRLMGGELHVKSTLGQGSFFWFELPLKTASVSQQGKARLVQPRITGIKGAKRTILIADDNLDNRNVLKDMLIPLGFEVLEASNGREALNTAIATKPDVILMDLVMPKLDGFEVTRQIRQFPEFNTTKILAVSASVHESAREKSRAAGCDDFLTKPIRFEELLSLLQKYLELEWTYAEPPVTREPEETDQRPLIFPPSDELTTLRNAAEIGDITSVKTYLAQLQNREPQFLPFVAKIRQFADKYQFEEILEFLNPYLAGEQA